LTVSKPVLKAPMVQRLKLHYHTLLSTFAFNFNLRRYNEALYNASPYVNVQCDYGYIQSNAGLYIDRTRWGGAG